MSKTETPVEQLSYEAARDQLIATVRQLETGQAPLEDALDLWERGEALAAHCQGFLDRAKARVALATGQDSPEQGDEGEGAGVGDAKDQDAAATTEAASDPAASPAASSPAAPAENPPA